ncbi:MAG TPA: PP2C family protein-serine/threonine phosphatase [bacterium]|nr:PP2C family protein-serine/threonine phosphatase [bacterium]HPR87253.1 PP2C family protein-serine/threonine phosphatase [bacterium]
MHSEKKGYRWPLLLAVALAGALLFALFAPRFLSVLPHHVTLNRTEAVKAAGLQLTAFGLPPDEYRSDASMQVRRDLIQYIENRYAPMQRDSALRQLPAYTWQITWTRPADYEQAPGHTSHSAVASFNEFVLQLDLYGKPVAFWSEPGKESLGVNLSDSMAQMLAVSTLRQALGDEARLYSLSQSNSSKLDSRTEHQFTFTRREPICGLQQQLNIVVSGAIISKFARQYNPPGISAAWQNSRAMRILPFTLLMLGLSLLYLMQLIRRLRSDSINFRTAMVPALASSGLTILIIALDPDHRDIYSLLMSTAVSAFMVGLAMLLAVAVGESSARSLSGEKLLNLDALLRGQFRHRAFARALLQGLCFGFGLAGLVALLLTVTSLFANVSLAEWGAELHRDASTNPFLFSLLNVFNQVLWYQFALVLALVSVLAKWLPRSGWAPLLFGLIAGIGLHDSFHLPSEPLAANMLIGGGMGLLFALILLRCDFIAVIMTHFTFATLFASARLLSLGHPTFWYSGLFLLAPLLAAAVVAAWGWPVYMSQEQLRNFLPRQAVKMVENERLKRELEIARRVQMSFLPKENPRLPGLEISSTCVPASEVGGDYYDFIDLGGNRLGFAIGDVSGKGVSAAFYMTLTKGFLRSLSRTTWGPAQILIEMNRLFYENVDRGHFISLIFGVLDLETRKLTIARAGHDPIFWYRPQDDFFERLLPPGIALGLEPGEIFDAIIKETTIDIHPGDLFVLYTDGFSEAMNQYANEFSEERLAQSIRRHADLPTEEILAKIKTQVAHFVGHSPQHDDMTMVIMRILPTA